MTWEQLGWDYRARFPSDTMGASNRGGTKAQRLSPGVAVLRERRPELLVNAKFFECLGHRSSVGHEGGSLRTFLGHPRGEHATWKPLEGHTTYMSEPA